jgi:hypothetical protein
MPDHTVVVVGSNQPFPEYTPGNFWVIDFSVPATPTAVSVPCASSGVVVDCSGMQAAVAACAGDTVTIYQVGAPATPSAIGSASLSFNGISAISFYGGYVLVGEASNDSGARVALIDVSNLASPQIYATSFTQITGVTLFGSTAVICGLGGYSNAFQIAKTSDFPMLATSVPMTNVSAWSEYAIPFMCDFDGANAVFSDGTGLYVYAISGGIATPITPQGGVGAATSVAIAQRLGPGNTAAAGIQLAYAAGDDPNVELQYIAPPVPPGANWFSGSASLGDPNNIYGQPIDFEGGVAKFCRNIYGASATLATAGVTQVAGGGTQECVVSLFDVKGGGVYHSDAARRARPRSAAEHDFAEQHARRHRFLYVLAAVVDSLVDYRVAVCSVVRLRARPDIVGVDRWRALGACGGDRAGERGGVVLIAGDSVAGTYPENGDT